MSRGQVTVTLPPATLQAIRRFVDTVNDVSRRLGDAFGSMARALLAYGPLTGRDRAIARFGPANLAGDGTWQSDLCASWVHEACCAPEHCDCTCHGGTVR